MQIMILGMHRSGTSATAGLVNMMGVHFGPESIAIPANSANPKGFWERKDVMAINDDILKQQGCSWDKISGFTIPATLKDLTKHQLNVLIHELEAHSPWFIKDPRLCLTLPAWRPHLSNPLAIIVTRDPQEIAISLHTRNHMPLAQGLALSAQYMAAARTNTSDLPHLIIHHEHLLHDPVSTTKTIHDFLTSQGVKNITLPGDQEITSFIEPALYRSKNTLNN